MCKVPPKTVTVTDEEREKTMAKIADLGSSLSGFISKFNKNGMLYYCFLYSMPIKKFSVLASFGILTKY